MNNDYVIDYYLNNPDVAKTLLPREEAIMNFRHKECMTLEETAKELNITRERVRQLESKSFAKLRKVIERNKINEEKVKTKEDFFNYILCSLGIYDDLEDLTGYGVINAMFLKGWLKPLFKEYKRALEFKIEPSENIEDLNLSERPLHCLKRYHIDTIKELCELTEEELFNMRNLGKKSFEEIVNKLNERGLRLKITDNEEDIISGFDFEADDDLW